MYPSPEEVLFDLDKIRFDLPLDAAFDMTRVRSVDDYRRLSQRLPSIRGQSYFFINRLEGASRLLFTVMTCDEGEITATYDLDIEPLGIARDELASGGRGDGNYPLPSRIETKIRRALRGQERWRLRGVKQ